MSNGMQRVKKSLRPLVGCSSSENCHKGSPLSCKSGVPRGIFAPILNTPRELDHLRSPCFSKKNSPIQVGSHRVRRRSAPPSLKRCSPWDHDSVATFCGNNENICSFPKTNKGKSLTEQREAQGIIRPVPRKRNHRGCVGPFHSERGLSSPMPLCKRAKTSAFSDGKKSKKGCTTGFFPFNKKEDSEDEELTKIFFETSEMALKERTEGSFWLGRLELELCSMALFSANGTGNRSGRRNPAVPTEELVLKGWVDVLTKTKKEQTAVRRLSGKGICGKKVRAALMDSTNLPHPPTPKDETSPSSIINSSRRSFGLINEPVTSS